MRKKYFRDYLISLLSLLLLNSYGCKQVENIQQTNENLQSDVLQSVTSENESFTFYEETPKFPDGEDALAAFLEKNICCPQKVKQSGIYGSIVISFVILKDGSIDFRKDETGCEKIEFYNFLKDKSGVSCTDTTTIELCEQEALRVLKLMPRWLPGKQNGNPVSVKYSLRIMFGNKPLIL